MTRLPRRRPSARPPRAGGAEARSPTRRRSRAAARPRTPRPRRRARSPSARAPARSPRAPPPSAGRRGGPRGARAPRPRSEARAARCGCPSSRAGRRACACTRPRRGRARWCAPASTPDVKPMARSPATSLSIETLTNPVGGRSPNSSSSALRPVEGAVAADAHEVREALRAELRRRLGPALALEEALVPLAAEVAAGVEHAPPHRPRRDARAPGARSGPSGPR